MSRSSRVAPHLKFLISSAKIELVPNINIKEQHNKHGPHLQFLKALIYKAGSQCLTDGLFKSEVTDRI